MGSYYNALNSLNLITHERQFLRFSIKAKYVTTTFVQITKGYPDLKFVELFSPFKSIALLSEVTSPVCREKCISVRNVNSYCLSDG